MLIASIVLEVFDIWMAYVGQETEKCQLIAVGCVDLETEKIQVISNCSIYER